MNKELQNLSRSVLLDEPGLPKMNRNIILSVAIIILLFTVWASNMIINDTVQIYGEVVRDNSENGFYIDAYVNASKVGSVHEGMMSYVNISGITNKKKIDAHVERIVKVPLQDRSGNTVYEVRVFADLNAEEKAFLDNKLIRGMDAQVEVVTGTRNLIQYYFSRIWDARNTNAY